MLEKLGVGEVNNRGWSSEHGACEVGRHVLALLVMSTILDIFTLPVLQRFSPTHFSSSTMSELRLQTPYKYIA